MKYSFGTGRRKTAVAQVRIYSKGSGKITHFDGKEVADKTFIEIMRQPLELLGKTKDFDITLILKGGGANSQAEAARLGVARALSKIDADYEKAMKKEGYLTRDPRMKERKKPGLKGARRAPQWQKR